MNVLQAFICKILGNSTDFTQYLEGEEENYFIKIIKELWHNTKAGGDRLFHTNVV